MNKCIFFGEEDKDLCCGCGNCATCPADAIKMVKDSEGFNYPQIDYEKCIDCGKCYRVCPITSKPTTNKPMLAYAVQNNNDSELLVSSSGGVFISIAKWIISQNGVVFGCVYNKDMRPIIAKAITINEAIKMQGSKYVASDLGNSYEEVKKLLSNSTVVLFTGTPCQVAGLKAYLGKDYENLFTMDFLCHGTPSQKFFNSSIKAFENKYKGKVVDYKFRDKEIGWGQNSRITLQKPNGKVAIVKLISDFNPYQYGFLQGKLNRYSCYNCNFVGLDRVADITVADYWGIREIHPQFEASKGVSIYLVNTSKGEKITNNICKEFTVVSSKVEDMAKENGALTEVAPHRQAIPKERAIIYKELDEKGYEYVTKTYLSPKMNVKRYVKKYLPFSAQKLLRRFL